MRWPQEKGQKDKHWFRKHCTENKGLCTMNSTKTEDELMCFGRVNCSYSTSETYRLTLVTNTVISHAREEFKDLNEEIE
jgi:3-methyladenine DNA glycosylase Mpg